MAHPIEHSKKSVERWGGQISDYLPIHQWFDASKAHWSDVRHRALRHHSEGIAHCEHAFGVSIRNSDGKDVPVRYIGEQHVHEDLGRIPSIQDWYSLIRLEAWMYGKRLPAKEEIVAIADSKDAAVALVARTSLATGAKSQQ